ncbi:hypothetical protein EOA64_00405 [Mesorhizobium sp. M1A.F.Ca.IN.022.02.1.1]|uniref:hypothetical protein n=1 Tax=unclassified Mesorhizobium TaxID=325217 RepID=UPI000FC9BB3E|nr:MULTISPECIES: hypothetical protein [unclassified Mesorhizobium]RUV65839.1 hypothetical protein EOA64_00405 [Mesorhizobium sp. M1A.F.Ca.IN.022.02.1.1]RWG25563.1 MAG: hypothetical protein EOQ60_29355 [Mesorhizobium sp.]RWI33408.1 MAG: hypothetical protein EOR13_17795 [Mesorhizobium sp.]TIS09993.1 MAG: hypothetical protein E5X10_22790 [Mesorhizobium sp.]
MKIPAQAALNSADFTRTLRRLIVPNSMTPEDVSVPGNWANVFSKVKVDDEVIVVPEDRTWRLHLLVVETGIGIVRTALLHAIDLTKVTSKQPNVEQPGNIAEDAPEPPDGYTVNFAPAHKWRAMTNDPHMVVSKDHRTRAEAVAAAVAHSKKASGLAA